MFLFFGNPLWTTYSTILGVRVIGEWFKPGQPLRNLSDKILGTCGSLIGTWILVCLAIFPAMAIFAYVFYRALFKGILHVTGIKKWEVPATEEDEETKTAA